MLRSPIKKSHLTFKQLLTEYWRVFVSSPVLFLLIPLILYFPRLFIHLQLPEENMLWGRTIFNSPITRLSYVYNFLIGTLSTIAISQITKNRIDNKQISLSKILKNSYLSWWKVIKTKLLVYIYILALSIIVVIPGLIHAFYWMFVIPVILFKGKEGKDAMRYSKKLVLSSTETLFFQLVGLFLVTLFTFMVFAFATLFISLLLVSHISFSTMFAYLDLLTSIFAALTVIPLTILFINRDALQESV